MPEIELYYEYRNTLNYYITPDTIENKYYVSLHELNGSTIPVIIKWLEEKFLAPGSKIENIRLV